MVILNFLKLMRDKHRDKHRDKQRDKQAIKFFYFQIC